MPVRLFWLALVWTLVACGGDEFRALSATGGGGAPSGGGVAGAAASAAAGGVAGSGSSSGSSGGTAGQAGGAGGGGAGASAGGSSGSGGAGAGASGGGTAGAGATGGGGGTGGVVSSCPAGGISTLKSAFSNPLDFVSVWEKYVTTQGTIDSSGGTLLAQPGMGAGHYVGIISKDTLPIDDCTLWIEVKAPLWPKLNGETYLMATVDSSKDAEITATPDTSSPSGLKLVFGVEENGVEDNQSIPYVPTQHRWWRMRFPSGKVAFDTSPDGKSWTEQRIASRPAGMNAARIEIGAGTWSANGTQPAATFDNLNLGPP